MKQLVTMTHDSFTTSKTTIMRTDFVHNILRGGTDEFKVQIIEPFGKIFTVGFKFSQAFTYFGKEMHQNDQPE